MKLIKVLFIGCIILTSNNVYGQNLVSEFINGKTKTYVCHGTAKSKGLKFQFKYPENWKEHEADRPNIVIKIFNDSTGSIQTMVMVKKMDRVLSASEIKSLLTKNAMAARIPKTYSNSKIEEIKIIHLHSPKKLNTKKLLTAILLRYN